MNYIIIRNCILSFLLSIIGICYAELDLDSINESKDWKFIQEGNINLKWTTYQGYPMCRVSTLLPYAIDSISKIIEDVENYPDIFKRVCSRGGPRFSIECMPLATRRAHSTTCFSECRRKCGLQWRR